MSDVVSRVADRRPASRRIADDLGNLIEAGELVPGQRLPSEREIAARYGAARNTAREAMRLLAQDGLVVPEPGRGVYVRAPVGMIRLGSDRYSRRHGDAGPVPFLRECAALGRTGRMQVLSVEREQPPPEVADRLGVSDKTPSVLCRQTLFWADGDPVQRVTTWIPWMIAAGSGLLYADLPHPAGVQGVLRERGFAMARLREEVGARMPRPEERGELHLPPGVPVLDVLHTSVDAADRPYALARYVIRADLSALCYDVPVD